MNDRTDSRNDSRNRDDRRQERDLLSLRDPQQAWDESTQSYEDTRNAQVPGRDYDRDYLVRGNDEGAYDVGYSSPHFASHFKRYSAGYHDREGGAPGIDNDFGMSDGGTQQWIGLRNLARDRDWTRSDRESIPSASHIGRGPKGYTPSAERLREAVYQALTDADDVDACDLEVAVDNGGVTLSGTVPSKRQRRAAEDWALSIPGGEDVMNEVRVDAHACGDEEAGDGDPQGGDSGTSDASRPKGGRHYVDWRKAPSR
jgi:osmotically-inducible protein OsmY